MRLHPRLNATSLILARALCGYADHDDGRNIRPGHARLTAATNLSLPSVRRHLRWLREAGLLEHVARGTRCPGGVRLAAEYAATLPAAWDEHELVRLEALVGSEDDHSPTPAVTAPPHPPVDVPASTEPIDEPCTDTPPTPSPDLGTDTYVDDELNRAGASARNRAPVTTRTEKRAGRRPAPRPGTRRARRWELARQVRSKVLLVARERVGRLAAALRPVADQGWTAEDVVAWLLVSPLPALVLFPVAWLRARLEGATAVWPQPPSVSRAVARRRRDESRLREQRAFRERVAADREAAVATEDRLADFGPVRATIRAHASAWLTAARSRTDRRAVRANGIRRGSARPEYVVAEPGWREPEATFLSVLPVDSTRPGRTRSETVHAAALARARAARVAKPAPVPITP
ncbi:ArsR family transcriptional regulator [Embleya scabrispora]|uniref:ArsR family transcriptional regulator n=1 Tax=Embleya scabrispora TaxID=159449 RepID=UPI00039C0354|nr:ArsR family transcriptional regulator [Embleya scabrispora]MYS87875.1 ArsR family transcriptional regulator [Streptomyces sp. SID5474]